MHYDIGIANILMYLNELGQLLFVTSLWLGLLQFGKL